MANSTETLSKIVCAIALHLDGFEWSYAPQYHTHAPPTQYIVHRLGPKLLFRLEKGRLCISGCFPTAPDGTLFAPQDAPSRITVHPGRNACSIAHDIHHRLLAAYLPAYFEALDRRHEYIYQQDRQTEIVLQLARALGAEVHPGRNEVYVPAHLPQYGHFRVLLSGEVEILRLSRLIPEQALQIVEVLTSPTEAE